MQQTISRISQKTTADPRIALLGVGHPLNGDDAAGIAIARALQGALPEHDHVLVLEAGPAPENQTGPLRSFGPDLVVFIDAAQMGAEPGDVQWLDWRDTSGLSASTHTLPPHVLAKFLVADLGCEVALLGLQPASNVVGAELSPIMQRAVDEVITALVAVLSAGE